MTSLNILKNKEVLFFIDTIKKNFFKTIGYTKFEEYKKKIFII